MGKKKQKKNLKTKRLINYKPRTRNYNAAMVNNLTASWTTGTQSIDQLVRSNLPILRARSREQVSNNDYMQRFLSLVKQNVIGQGITMQSRVMNDDGTQDKAANDAIEKAWRDFSKRENCDVEGRMGMIDMTRLYISTVAEDGECVIRKYYNEGKYNYQLRFYDADYLAFNYNEDRKNGDYVRFGILFNESGKRLGYYFYDSNYHQFSSTDTSYVPANEIIHEFIIIRAMQKRGIPWASTALLRLNMLGGYEEAALVNARTGASKMGFYTTPDGDYMLGEQQDDGTLMQNAEPGMFEQLPNGVEFTSYDPAYPSGEFSDFITSSLRGIASGLNVSYHNLANDLSQVNYSSARVGELSDREVWKMLQDWVIESFLMPVFNDWLRTAMVTGELKTITGRPFPYTLLDKFNAPTFQGRRWQWVDPLKEANAQIALAESNLKSKSAIIREQGLDPDDVWLEIQRENERMKELGITAPEDVSVQDAVTVAEEMQENEDETND